MGLPRILVIGIQRSGTTYVADVLKHDFGIDGLGPEEGFWKHAMPDECRDRIKDFHFFVVTRHPVMWLQSCLLHTPRDLITRRKDFFQNGAADTGSYAAVYSEFYQRWTQEASGSIVRYEDILSDKIETIARLLGPDIAQLDLYREGMTPVPQSLSFSEEDFVANSTFRCSLDPLTVRDFWARLDPGLLETNGYKLADVSFSEKASVRSVGYRFLRNPADVDEEEYSEILRLSSTRFANDGALLEKLLATEMSRGNLDSGLRVGMQALSAYQALIDTYLWASGAHTPQIAVIDQLLELLQRKKSILLENGIANFNQRLAVLDQIDIEKSDNYFVLSDFYNRAGNLDKAIELAELAIQEGLRIRARGSKVNPWFFHHLGALLSRRGSHEEAAINFERAYELDPDESLYIDNAILSYAVSSDFLGAVRACRRALSQRPHDQKFKHLLSTHRRDLALQHLDAGRRDEAAEVISSALADDPNDSRNHYIAAEIYYRSGDIPAAVSASEQAVRLSPPVAWHLHLLGHLYEIQGRYGEGIDAFTRASVIDPNDPSHLIAVDRLRTLLE